MMIKYQHITNILLGLLLIYFASSFGFSAKLVPEPIAKKTVATETPELKKVTEEFNKIESKDDRVLIYKLFAGAAEYLNNCQTMTETSQFDPLLGKVQTSYGWDRERYSAFTDVVSDYLISMDYETPKKLETKDQRKDFAKIFQGLAEATKYE